MFDKTQTPEARLTAFRRLRQTPDLDTTTIVEAFADVEILPRYLDYYTPDSWPNVFDIVNEGYFCQSGVTLLITSIMQYTGFIKTPTIQLDAVSNDINGHQGLVLMHEDLCYNFIPGEIVTAEYAKDHSINLDSHIIKPDNLFH